MTITRIFAVFLLLISTQATAVTRLSQATIDAMLIQIQQAAQAKDAASLIAHFDPKATIILDMPAELGGKIKLDVAQFKANLQQAWATPAEFSYQTNPAEVAIAADGLSANTRYTSVESIRLNGLLLLSTHTQQQMQIHIRNGQPAISRLYGKVNM